MVGFRLSEEAETELDEIWYYIARQSGAAEVADRVIASVSSRFWFLGQHPYAGRERNDLRAGLRSFPADDYVIIYRVDDDETLILHVLHHKRDMPAIFQH